MAQWFPMIQTHSFAMEPYLPNTQGYAFFIFSSGFSGKEKIQVTAPKSSILPDLGMNARVLNQYADKKWFISDENRVVSATGGPLDEGAYVFTIESEGQIQSVSLDYQASFLKPAKNIQLQDAGSIIEASWLPDSKANTSWVFAFSVDTKDILNDLVPLSSVMHVGNTYKFKKSLLKIGTYRLAIRSNQLWEREAFRGFQSEAWSISTQTFSVP